MGNGTDGVNSQMVVFGFLCFSCTFFPPIFLVMIFFFLFLYQAGKCSEPFGANVNAQMQKLSKYAIVQKV